VKLVTGPSGCGKTFAAKLAIREAGFDLVTLDDLSETVGWNEDAKKSNVETKIRQALISGPDPWDPLAHHDKTVRVVLIDDVEGLELSFLRKVQNVLSCIIDPQKLVKGKRRKTVLRGQSFWLNPVVITAETKHKNIAALARVLKLSKNDEIKCNVPNLAQRNQMMMHACNYLETVPNEACNSLVKASSDMTFFLNQIDFMLLYDIVENVETTAIAAAGPAKDRQSMDPFVASRQLMVASQKQQIQYTDWALTRHLGGFLVEKILYNTYPKIVAPVQSLLSDNGLLKSLHPNTHVHGLDQLADIADMYSLHDLHCFTGPGQDRDEADFGFSNDLLGRTLFHTVCANRHIEFGKLHIECNENPWRSDTVFSGVDMTWRAREAALVAHTAHCDEVHLIMTTNSKMEQTEDYKLSRVVGWHLSPNLPFDELEAVKDLDAVEFVWCDTLDDPDQQDKKMSKKKKLTAADGVLFHRAKAIEILSHKFERSNSVDSPTFEFLQSQPRPPTKRAPRVPAVPRRKISMPELLGEHYADFY
jgi:hypothetical protein